MAAESSTIHASAVLVGAKAVLIRGPSGSGKSRLAWDLIQAADQGALPLARLVVDDRALVEAHINQYGGRLIVRPAPALAGMIEIYGLGVRQLPYEPVAAVWLVVDLAAPDADRMPPDEAGNTVISGVTLPRLSVAGGMAALPLVLAFMRTKAASD
jgi:serine kinase of HPr protein (carbohydrate metabolism regulator)